MEETIQGLENEIFELEETGGTIDQDTINDAANEFNSENEDEILEEKISGEEPTEEKEELLI